MDTVTAIVSGAGALVESLIAQAHFAAIVLGFAVSFGFTQWVKGFVRLRYYHRAVNPHDLMTTGESMARYRQVIRTVAIASGSAGTLILWPGGPWPHRIVWAAAVGFLSPTLYWVGIRVLASKFPAVAAYLSADSKLPGASPPAEDPQA